MILKIQKNTVEKVIQCGGYVRTRFAYRETDDEPRDLGPTERADVAKLPETHELGIQEPIQKGWKAITVIEPRGASCWGSFNLPEEPPNRLFVCNDAGDTIDRLNWG